MSIHNSENASSSGEIIFIAWKQLSRIRSVVSRASRLSGCYLYLTIYQGSQRVHHVVPANNPIIRPEHTNSVSVLLYTSISIVFTCWSSLTTRQDPPSSDTTWYGVIESMSQPAVTNACTKQYMLIAPGVHWGKILYMSCHAQYFASMVNYHWDEAPTLYYNLYRYDKTRNFSFFC